MYTDHANLRYYCDPCKIRPQVAGYLLEREQYNILLEYKSGATNRANALSCCPNYEIEGNPDNEDVTIWPDKYFCKEHTRIHITDLDTLDNTLKQHIKHVQYPKQMTLK